MSARAKVTKAIMAAIQITFDRRACAIGSSQLRLLERNSKSPP
jgi:hypothetical protein